MTDRASAEGLRERIESLIDDDEAAYVSVALIRAALRDTGPRPDALAVIDAWVDYHEGRRDDPPIEETRRVRLSTPRTETDELHPECAKRGYHRDGCDVQPPWRDDQGYWLGGMGTPGPRPEPIATLSLYEQGRRQTLMDLGFDIDGIDTATAVEAARDTGPSGIAACVCGRTPPSRPWNSDDPCRDGNGNFNPGHGYSTPETGDHD